MDHFYALIMAGGGGTRLWPMSRGKTPKQFLPLVEDDSMFRVSITRLAPLFTPDRIYVVAGERYAEALKADAPEIPEQNFILEPSARDSGPAAALGAAVIHKRDPQATIAILTADHHITNKQGFRDALAAAYELAQQGHIVTLGITPDHPSTGFGYIRRGEPLAQANGLQAYHSLGFTEKPNAERAAEFLASGEYSWNSGMFIWRADTALQEFERQRIDSMYTPVQTIAAGVDTPDYNRVLNEYWGQIEKISLDYAVMEKAAKMAVVPVEIGWNDVGSWSALYDMLPQDDGGNILKGSAPQWIQIDTKDTLVFGDKLVVTIGVEDLIIVQTGDSLMICRKDRAQDVKQVVERLKAEQKSEYL
ncbi:MAG: mannose-1-phosphate guanylyltransferase [Chloroflexota bacterium]|nr:mannose-1-phosphate guanylyltransferase [Chloroflexota bacterium]